MHCFMKYAYFECSYIDRKSTFHLLKDYTTEYQKLVPLRVKRSFLLPVGSYVMFRGYACSYMTMQYLCIFCTVDIFKYL